MQESTHKQGGRAEAEGKCRLPAEQGDGPRAEGRRLTHWTTHVPLLLTTLSTQVGAINYIHTVVQPSPPPISGTSSSSPN